MNSQFQWKPAFADEVSPRPGEKLHQEKKTASALCALSEKPVLKAGESLPNRWREEIIQKTTPTHHENEAKWEIPIYLLFTE
jgi:hypothetical protein